MFMLTATVTEPAAVSRLEKILDKLFADLSALGSNLITAILVAVIGWYIIKFYCQSTFKGTFPLKT